MLRNLLGVMIIMFANASLANNPVVEMQTSAGTIKIELYAQAAPKSVENFLDYAASGHYEGTVFHRVIKGFVVQGGGYNKDYQLKPTKAPIKNEAEQALKAGLKNEPGTVSMARTADPNSATSQFYINVGNNSGLDFPSRDGYGYCVFGKVIAGMDVVNKIAESPTGAGGPFPKDVPQQAVVVEKVTVVKAAAK